MPLTNADRQRRYRARGKAARAAAEEIDSSGLSMIDAALMTRLFGVRLDTADPGIAEFMKGTREAFRVDFTGPLDAASATPAISILLSHIMSRGFGQNWPLGWSVSVREGRCVIGVHVLDQQARAA